MIAVYTLLFVLALCVTFPYWVWRAWKKREMHLTAARLGWAPWPTVPTAASGAPTVWVHAVSVGEVQAASALIWGIREISPSSNVVLSVTTRTGMETANRLMAGRPGVTGPVPFPLDLPWAVSRRLDEIRPDACVFIDTEIWPNLITAARRRGVKLFIANGRISDKSFGRYRVIRPFLRPVLEGIDAFWMQSDENAQRITRLGAPAGRVKVMGNLKIDSMMIQLRAATNDAPEFREDVASPPVLLAASTHPGEESIVMTAASRWRDAGREFRLAIAPRHPERAGSVRSVIEASGFRAVSRSAEKSSGGRLWPDGSSAADVLLIDMVGELNRYFPMARVVFVGGSLVPSGGHNIFEPAAFGRAVVFGPHMENFRDAMQAMDGHGAVRLASARDFGPVMDGILFDAGRAHAMGQDARRTFSSLGGAARRIAAELMVHLNHG